jgi:signal peptide peptidase SppA
MNNKVPINVLNAIYDGRWAILPDKLDLLVSIANRTHSDIEAVLSKPLEQRIAGSRVDVRDGAAIINIIGPIIPRATMFSDISGAVSAEDLALKFGEAIEDHDIKAIVLNIDSPGGNIVNVHELSDMIYNARGKKPVIAYTGGLCASAAYWIASACDKIIADKTAFLGSIGVVAAWTDDSEARKKEGLKDYELVSSQSPNKRQDLNSKEGRAALQAELDGLADIFIDDIAQKRGTNSQFVNDNYGKGGVMLALQAIQVGMADELGSLEGVIQSIKDGNQNVKLLIKSTSTKGVSFMSNKDEDDKAKTSVVAVIEDDDEEEDESEEEEEKAKGKSKSKGKAKSKDAADPMASLLASDPALFNRIKQTGAAEERARIKAIDDIVAVHGSNSAIVKDAMFTNPISAEAFAFKVLKTEASSRVLMASNYNADADEIPSVPASGDAESNSGDVNNKILSAIVSGLKIGGCKGVKHG